jgi:signal transduction histidine kinase
LRVDPAATLLVVRQVAPRLASPAVSFFPAVLHDPAVGEGALRFLQLDRPLAGFIDWSHPAPRPVYQATLAYARVAHLTAAACGRGDPENAWVCGLLAPLGWHAACTSVPDAVAACLDDPEFAHDPAAVQQRRWGLDHAALARRLLRRWNVPDWLAACTGHLGLPADVAAQFGADPDLFRIVQLAVGLVQERAGGLRLGVGADVAELAAALSLTADDLAELRREAGRESPAPDAWESPAGTPLLADLLALAAENSRLRDVPTVARLEGEHDRLHQALEQGRAEQARLLQGQKLAALAEFAAGAGHEINNPLAVISGQAQYLLRQIQKSEVRSQKSDGEAPESIDSCLLTSDFSTSLHTIIGQTQRIHVLLNELMQFARPPRPKKQAADAAGLVREVAATLTDAAAGRKVRLVCPEPAEPLALHVDPGQARTALTCLLRNAIEAAPADGWAGVRLEAPAPDRLDLVVEDNGTGPPPVQREHLFDPFFSGRQAGRGRGLGLPTAWRLAREQGGDVRFDTPPGGPTRFVLSLPRYTTSNGTPHAENGHAVPAKLVG